MSDLRSAIAGMARALIMAGREARSHRQAMDETVRALNASGPDRAGLSLQRGQEDGVKPSVTLVLMDEHGDEVRIMARDLEVRRERARPIYQGNPKMPVMSGGPDEVEVVVTLHGSIDPGAIAGAMSHPTAVPVTRVPASPAPEDRVLARESGWALVRSSENQGHAFVIGPDGNASGPMRCPPTSRAENMLVEIVARGGEIPTGWRTE